MCREVAMPSCLVISPRCCLPLLVVLAVSVLEDHSQQSQQNTWPHLTWCCFPAGMNGSWWSCMCIYLFSDGTSTPGSSDWTGHCGLWALLHHMKLWYSATCSHGALKQTTNILHNNPEFAIDGHFTPRSNSTRHFGWLVKTSHAPSCSWPKTELTHCK